jgi:CTP:molybdopterin cytidylyltransferase MocA
VKIVAIVLAAGEGRRIGGPKALLSRHGRTFLAHACHLLARPGVAEVVAVIGASAARVRSEAPVPDDVTVVENEAWSDGMLSSVWCGLDAAENLAADAVLLHPVDHPLVSPATVDRVVDALRQGAFAAVPTHAGRRGHPGGFGREAFDPLRAAPLDQGARAVLAGHAHRVVHVEGDPGCLVGIDTPEQYRRHLGS